MAQTLSPANRDLRLIPLLKAECEKPLRIGALTHIDFTDGADLDLAWRQLLTALGKPPEPQPPKEPKRDEWFSRIPIPMPPNFTGRDRGARDADRWLDADAAHPLLALRALGGFGKSALDLALAHARRGARHLAARRLVELLRRRCQLRPLPGRDAPLSQRRKDRRGEDLRQGRGHRAPAMLHLPGTLLVLDGFERVLRAFGGLDAAYQGDEGRPELPDSQDAGSASHRRAIASRRWPKLFLYNVALQPQLRSKVLLTTRLCPRVLEAKGGGLLPGCREEQLPQMQPADAVEFFRAQGIRGTHTEIETACAPYGYHPLSLRLLAGLIVGDFQQPGDIAAAKRLDVSGDLVQRQHHVLETAYDSLTPARQALLGRIACFRSPVSYETL